MESWSYFLEVENLENLRKVVLEDLKSLGVNTKLLKNKKNKNKDDSFVTNNGSAFGNSIDLVPTVFVEGCGPVPRVLTEIGSIVEDNITTEGLFRKSGSVLRKKELIAHIENGGSLDGANIFDVTGILKTFLRQLPVSLLAPNQGILTAFEQAHNDGGNERRIDALQLLVLLLPQSHICTLRYLLLLLLKVADRSDKNKMDVSNLALCLGPNLFPASSQTKADGKTMQIHTSIVQLLILHSSYIGMVSNGTMVRISSQVSMLSDNDLDRSCDIRDDSERRSRDKKKKKKKRRSSSLQGLVESLSSSFTRRRRSRSHNTSNISDKSSIYVKSSVKSSSDSLCVNNVNSVGGQTPKLKCKRKADNPAFSITKKRAILDNMPQKSLLSSSNQFTPSLSVDMKFSHPDDSSIVFSATIDEGNSTLTNNENSRTPKSSKMRRVPSAKSGCFSPQTKTVKKKKSSFMAFVKRLSGSRENSPIRLQEYQNVENIEINTNNQQTSSINQKLMIDDIKFDNSPTESNEDLNISRQISSNCLNKAFISDEDFLMDKSGSINSDQIDGDQDIRKKSCLSLNSQISSSTAISSCSEDIHMEITESNSEKVESVESLDSAICMKIIHSADTTRMSLTTPPPLEDNINEQNLKDSNNDVKTPCQFNYNAISADDVEESKDKTPLTITTSSQLVKRMNAMQNRRHTLTDPNLNFTGETRCLLARAGLPPHRTIRNFANSNGLVASKVQHIETTKSIDDEKLDFVLRSKRHASPVRIPTIFAKTEPETLKYKEKIDRIKSPNLPISCKLPREAENNRALNQSSKVTVSAPVIKPSLGNFDVNLIRKRSKNVSKDEKEFVL